MTLRLLLLGCGLASSVLYVSAIDVLAPIVRPDYHSYRYQMVSELVAYEAPTRPVLGPPMIVYNVLVVAFAAGVWLSAKGRRAMRLTAVALAVYGIISTAGFFLTPMDVRGPQGVTERDVRHIVATVVQGIALVLALVLGGLSLGRRFRLYSFATLVLCAVFGALAGLAATREVSPWLGITERVSIYSWMLWMAVLSVALLRIRNAKGPPGEALRTSNGTTR